MKKIKTVTLNAQDTGKTVVTYDEVDEKGTVIKENLTLELDETGHRIHDKIERVIDVMEARLKEQAR